jgi:MoaA/NifB/PqqE/SkfB family radical SAM enzyme
MSEPAQGFGIEVKVTQRCDQACFHCVNDDRPNVGRDIDGGMIEARLREWGENRARSGIHVKEVRMTGGEPLLALSSVLGIARTCSSLGLRSGINTNGAALDEAALDALRDAGLSIIKVSFDTVDEATLRRMRGPGASADTVVRGIRLAVARGFRVILRLTLCRHNAADLLATYRAARDLDVDALQVKPLIGSGRAAHSGARLTRDRVCSLLHDLAEAVEGTSALPQILCWPPGEMGGLPGKACGSLDKIYIGVDGTVTTCNYIPNPTALGDVGDESLADILTRRSPALWRSAEGDTILAGCPQAIHFP